MCPDRRRHRLIAAAAFLTLLSSATGTGVASAGDVIPAARLAWRSCTAQELRGWQCATLTVPRDYEDPSHGTFNLAVVRLKADGKPSQRVGSLFVNAGGPGIPTIAEAPILASLLPASLRSRFDFVAWDPRGVGQSHPLEGCTGADSEVPATGPVDWTAVMAQLRTTQAAANRLCEQRYPDVLPYLGTNNVVRDLDLLRQAVGDRALTYWGPSYGSRIGYVYATTFPDRVRAIIETGAVNPSGSIADLARGVGFASDDAVRAMFAAYPGLQETYRSVAAALELAPLTLPSGYVFTRWDLAVRLFLAGAYESDWPKAAQLIDALETARHGQGQQQADAAAYIDAGLHYGGIATQGPAEVFINCLDYADRPTPHEQDAIAADMRQQSPMTAAILPTFALQCAGMTVPADPVPKVGRGQGATGLLIATAANDGRTPYRWTKAMARAFPDSRVITYVGGNHTVFLTVPSSCVNQIGAKYLLSGRLPHGDTSCPSAFRDPDSGP